MAEACRPVEGFERFAGGQTAVSNAVKNTWLGPVAAKVVALDRLAGRFGCCQLPWKNVRKRFERP